MEQKTKKNILKQLAKRTDPAVQDALNKEAKKASIILSSSSDYDELLSSLDVLDSIAYRVPTEAVLSIKSFLSRLEAVDLSYADVPGYPAEQRKKYQNKNTLIINALKILDDVRYHETERVLDILFSYSTHENETVQKQAIQNLTEFSKYHLEIFFGDGKNWAGLGSQPQQRMLERIQTFDNQRLQILLNSILSICKEMLSSTMSGTRWTYKTVTLSTGPILATDGVKSVRDGTLALLERIYDLANDPHDKKRILGTMYEAGRTPHQGEYGDDVLAMIMDGSTRVLEFIKKKIHGENLEVIQSVEHSVYYMFRRGGNDNVGKLALEIKDLIDKNEEYSIFKILIGYEGVFNKWALREETEERDFQGENKYREEMAKKYAESITEETYPDWRRRILDYASIQSNDMATFPYFGKFLQHLANHSPALAFRLLRENGTNLERFFIAILLGLWSSSEKDKARGLIELWISEGKHLFEISRMLAFSDDFEEDLLGRVLIKASANSNIAALIQITSAASAQYKGVNDSAIKNLFLPALQKLTSLGSVNWVYDFWYRTEKRDIFSSLNDQECELILSNLLLAEQITYQHEEVLAAIASQHPQPVIKFFCDRIAIEKERRENGKYEAVPYDFHSLAQPLAKIPKQAVQAVFESYDGNYGMFIYKGGRLLQNIFPDMPGGFEQELIDLVRKNTEKTSLFVLGILRNYDGDIRIQGLCKELVKILPEGSLLNETSIALQSTGVVGGEFGFVEAYKTKIEEMVSWLDEPNERVRDFANVYISDLKKKIEHEKKRADEGIALGKHQYGFDEHE